MFKDSCNKDNIVLIDVSRSFTLPDKDKPKKFDEVSKSELYKEVKKIGSEFKLMPGDLAKISSWGVKDGQPVLIDSGLTQDVFDKYYGSTSSSSS